MYLRCVCVALVAGTLAAAADPTWDDCSGGSLMMNITNAVCEPPAPKKSMDFNITWTGDLQEDVAAGSVAMKMWVKTLGVWIPAPHTFTYDICELNACPVKAGTQTLKIHTNMPSVVPSGDYKVQVSLSDASSTAISCADVYYTV
eukprot:g2133.t1